MAIEFRDLGRYKGVRVLIPIIVRGISIEPLTRNRLHLEGRAPHRTILFWDNASMLLECIAFRMSEKVSYFWIDGVHSVNRIARNLLYSGSSLQGLIPHLGDQLFSRDTKVYALSGLALNVAAGMIFSP
jgi:hypothetical protein